MKKFIIWLDNGGHSSFFFALMNVIAIVATPIIINNIDAIDAFSKASIEGKIICAIGALMYSVCVLFLLVSIACFFYVMFIIGWTKLVDWAHK